MQVNELVPQHMTDDGGPVTPSAQGTMIFAPEQPAPQARQDCKPGDPDWDIDYAHPARGRVEIVNADSGEIRLYCADGTPCTKFGIVGFSPSTRDLAPHHDPTWVIVGLNQLSRWLVHPQPDGSLRRGRADVWFEVHEREVYTADIVRGTDYVKWLQTARLPIMMLERTPEIPTSIRYPLEGAIKWIGRDYFQSSIAYELVYACMLGMEDIGIWGVDLIASDNEYHAEKANLEYLIGMAQARGHRVHIPEGSALLKQRSRYGLKPPDTGPINTTTMGNRVKELMERRDKLLQELYAIDGVVSEYQMLTSVYTLHQRGGQVVTTVKPSSL